MLAGAVPCTLPGLFRSRARLLTPFSVSVCRRRPAGGREVQQRVRSQQVSSCWRRVTNAAAQGRAGGEALGKGCVPPGCRCDPARGCVRAGAEPGGAVSGSRLAAGWVTGPCSESVRCSTVWAFSCRPGAAEPCSCGSVPKLTALTGGLQRSCRCCGQCLPLLGWWCCSGAVSRVQFTWF